ncbi:zinc-binding dehydrogenase [Humisphaera borealis]|uniref:alcohol dehydrogenase n=1 Tax=Humisphaera borealis TaxID=2807512 RepID=A0A7M2WUN6_9BACT|nr:zinc-binding dehydrogenase [Humisphaera borealis]QOV89216.1 zinc-binding dehydrogenase [Humisphaera borealis]
MTSAQAAVFSVPGTHPVLQSVALPRLVSGEALVRVSCCTICGSDVHSWTGKRQTPLPTILGHEIVGVVEGLGSDEPPVDLNGEPLAIGDRIVWAVVASCGRCDRCVAGMPQKCRFAWKYGHQALNDVVPGHQHTAPLSGGLATHCHLVPGTAVVRVPTGVPDELASTATCAGATVMNALAAAGELKGKRLLVTGAGMLGLLACAAAGLQSPASTTVVDLNVGRLNDARRLGASLGSTEVPQGQFDILIECTGNSALTTAAISRLDLGGRAILVGAVYPDDPLPIDAQSIVRRLITIRGIHNYTAQDLAAALSFFAGSDASALFKDLIGRRIPLSDVDSWVSESEKGSAARVAVIP